MYKPPFTITNSMLNYSISISQKIEKFFSYQSLKRMPMLRRNNRIKSIHKKEKQSPKKRNNCSWLVAMKIKWGN